MGVFALRHLFRRTADQQTAALIAALIALALGLVFLWLTFWMVGGVMAGLVRAVCGLARKWCSKEVPAE